MAVCTRTVLMAPAGYPRRGPEGTTPFERHLALEALRDWCCRDGADERGAFLVGFLEQALRRAVCGGRAPGADALGAIASDASARGGKPQFPEVYCLRTQSLSVPQLTVTNSTPGEWVYFTFDGRGTAVSLRWRLRDHWVELVLKAAQVSRDRLDGVLTTNPLLGADVSPRGTSELVVWMPTPELDLLADLASQREAIKGALDIVAALSMWYGHVRRELETDVRS